MQWEKWQWSRGQIGGYLVHALRCTKDNQGTKTSVGAQIEFEIPFSFWSWCTLTDILLIFYGVLIVCRCDDEEECIDKVLIKRHTTLISTYEMWD